MRIISANRIFSRGYQCSVPHACGSDDFERGSGVVSLCGFAGGGDGDSAGVSDGERECGGARSAGDFVEREAGGVGAGVAERI